MFFFSSPKKEPKEAHSNTELTKAKSRSSSDVKGVRWLIKATEPAAIFLSQMYYGTDKNSEERSELGGGGGEK